MKSRLLMALSTWLFATMGVLVKLASADYGVGEIVFYRGVIGIALMALWCRHRGIALGTRVPAMHVGRSVSGVAAMMLWFYGIGHLPLATAVTLNYMSSVWMALFLLGGSVLLGTGRLDGRLVLTVLAGFAGVVMVLRPTLDQQQLWAATLGLLSGVLSATAYLQVTALGRAGEPEPRVVLYFSLCGALSGLLLTSFTGGWHGHSLQGALMLAAIGLLATTAQMLMTQAYAIGRPLVNASLQYLGIVFSFGYGVWLFDDPVSLMALAGMGLIIAAGLAATLLRHRQAPQADGPDTEL